ncbi:class I SAM-dependent methyltransferase [Thermodesulfobacteriota bacterium]
MEKAIIQQTFDKAAGDYDRIKVQIIPKYREMERLIQEYISFPRNRRVGILELGTGTGKWASGMLNKYPKAHYYGIDFSGNMLDAATEKLKKFGDRYNLQNLDLNEEQPTGKYDLIHSAFTLHHVREKKRLFKVLFSLLKRGGCFLYMDITIAKGQDQEAMFMKRWKDFMTNSSWPNNRIKTIIDDHLKNDMPETVENQLRCLGDAGFKSYDVIWRYDKFAVFLASK